MNQSADANNSATKALKKLKSQGITFSNEAFLMEMVGDNVQNVALFIEAGIDVNEPVDDDPPIVMVASRRRGNCEIAQLLINNGAGVNAQSKDGLTAIRMAIFNNHKELVKLLIANGADVNLKSENGTPLDLASRKGLTEIAELLTAHGAKKMSEVSAPNKVNEITHLVERLELLEEKFGIAISGVYATCQYVPNWDPPYYHVIVNFEVASLSGGELKQDLKILATAYNADGQLLEKKWGYLLQEKFLGFSPESITAELNQAPTRIRLFPTAM
jgi:hypothetical protein